MNLEFKAWFIIKKQEEEKMNILAIGAHPDDVEMNCAGTLAKFAHLGHKVFLATATNGNVGSAVMSKEEIARVRFQEATNSAALIGAEYIGLGYDDEMFFEDKEARLKFIDLVRYCKADVIITHPPKDYNPDHELTSKIINDICIMIPVAKIETPNPPYRKMPTIFYFEPVHGFEFIPSDYVDITDFYETKIRMLGCHVSQQQWLQDNLQAGAENDGFSQARITAMYRGMQGGVKYAEAFLRARVAHRMTCDRVLP